MRKSINFIIILLIFELSINILVYIDVVAELIERDLGCHSSVPEICVKMEDVYFDMLGIFMMTALPVWLLSYLYTQLRKSKFWMVAIMGLFSWVWVDVSFQIIGAYTSYLGHTWSDEEVWAFSLGQEHYWVAYGLAILAMLWLGYLNLMEEVVSNEEIFH